MLDLANNPFVTRIDGFLIGREDAFVDEEAQELDTLHDFSLGS